MHFSNPGDCLGFTNVYIASTGHANPSLSSFWCNKNVNLLIVIQASKLLGSHLFSGKCMASYVKIDPRKIGTKNVSVVLI